MIRCGFLALAISSIGALLGEETSRLGTVYGPKAGFNISPPEGWVVTLGQVATFYYYFHFLILMPLLGKIERPRPLPISIGTAVLEATGGLSTAGSAERH